MCSSVDPTDASRWARDDDTVTANGGQVVILDFHPGDSTTRVIERARLALRIAPRGATCPEAFTAVLYPASARWSARPSRIPIHEE